MDGFLGQSDGEVYQCFVSGGDLERVSAEEHCIQHHACNKEAGSEPIRAEVRQPTNEWMGCDNLLGHISAIIPEQDLMDLYSTA